MTASEVITGRGGTVQRVRPSDRRAEFPLDQDTTICDVWILPGPGSMRMAIVGDEFGSGYAVILAYIDPGVRALAQEMDLAESLCVDLWHLQKLPGCTDARTAREIAKGLARAVSTGALAGEPIQPAQREVWQVAVDSVSAVVTGAALANPKLPD